MLGKSESDNGKRGAVYCAVMRHRERYQERQNTCVVYAARRDERDSEGEPLRRGDVYIANVPLYFNFGLRG